MWKQGSRQLNPRSRNKVNDYSQQFEIGITFATSMTRWSCLQPQLRVRFHIWLWSNNGVKHQTVGAQMLKQLHHSRLATLQHHTKPLALSYQDTSYSRVVMITCGGKGRPILACKQKQDKLLTCGQPLSSCKGFGELLCGERRRVFHYPLQSFIKARLSGSSAGTPQNPRQSGSWIPTFCSMFKPWHLQRFGPSCCKKKSNARCEVAKLLL